MADLKITELDAYTPPIDTDVLAIVDVTTSTTKKVTWANLKATIAGITLLPATGNINSVNVDFTFTEKPTYIIMDGVWYRENKGWAWTAGTLTATMVIPPNDDIYGMV